MRTQLATFSENISAPFSPRNNCQDSKRKDLDYASLRKALVACFVEIGGSMSFEGGKINRQTALDLLHEIQEPERRKVVFAALGPLWKALNGDNESDSPYRRLIAMAVQTPPEWFRDRPAARDAGVDAAEVERLAGTDSDAWRHPPAISR